MGPAYRSCKLSNAGAPTTALPLRKCGARPSIPKLLRRRGAALLAGKTTPHLEEILPHHFPDVASPAMQDGASRIKGHPDRRLYLHEWRHDELHRVDVHVQKCGPWLRQPVLHSSFELVRPNSIEIPPSPAMHTTGRPGSAFWSPMDDGKVSTMMSATSLPIVFKPCCDHSC